MVYEYRDPGSLRKMFRPPKQPQALAQAYHVWQNLRQQKVQVMRTGFWMRCRRRTGSV
jgi:hypothetical protein